MASTPSKSTLVIGIDFSTTFTGVSWLFCKKNSPIREPEVVTQWLSALVKNSDRTKVPSKIYYDEETGEIKWGYNIPTDVQSIQWFKLLLLEKSDLPNNLKNSSHIEKARDLMKKAGKSTVELIGDYLKVLWKHVLADITAQKGRSLVNAAPYHVIFSVPAFWKDYARERMRQAAEHAGILDDRIFGKTVIDFISEPEAAALATLPDINNTDDLSVGDSFVVMDAGRGTIDIISYNIEKLDPMVVSECVEGDGALCGATFVDTAFEKLMEKRVGPKSWQRMELSAIRKMMNSEWEHGVKKDFDGSQKRYCIDLPKKTKRGQIDITKAEIIAAFDQVLSNIYDLLQKQLDAVKARTNKAPKFVILVGGFGRCPFLFISLESRFKNKVEVLQSRGEKPWSAICRGTALFGATGHGLTEQVMKVGSRTARLNYGWAYTTRFNPDVHDERDKSWHSITGEWRAVNQMEWGIRRGQSISAIEPKTYTYHIFHSPYSTGIATFTEVIYTSADVHPSSRLDHTVREHSTVIVSSPIPREEIELRKENGKKFREWRHNIELQVSGASLILKITSDGQDIGLSTLKMTTE